MYLRTVAVDIGMFIVERILTSAFNKVWIAVWHSDLNQKLALCRRHDHSCRGRTVFTPRPLLAAIVSLTKREAKTFTAGGEVSDATNQTGQPWNRGGPLGTRIGRNDI